MDRYQIYTHLKDLGYTPKIIVDCGAAGGEWSSLIKSIFNDSFIIGIDANKWCQDKIPGTDITEIAVLSNNNENKIFYRKKEHIENGQFCTGDSLFIEDTQHYQENNTIKDIIQTTTLTDVLHKYNITNNIDLLKIDTQGSELLIMQGLGDLLYNIEFIELEVSLVEYNIGGCLFNDVIDFLKDKFSVFDIIEMHRHHKYYLCQLDIIFQNKRSSIKKLK